MRPPTRIPLYPRLVRSKVDLRLHGSQRTQKPKEFFIQKNTNSNGEYIFLGVSDVRINIAANQLKKYKRWDYAGHRTLTTVHV